LKLFKAGNAAPFFEDCDEENYDLIFFLFFRTQLIILLLNKIGLFFLFDMLIVYFGLCLFLFFFWSMMC